MTLTPRERLLPTTAATTCHGNREPKSKNNAQLDASALGHVDAVSHNVSARLGKPLSLRVTEFHPVQHIQPRDQAQPLFVVVTDVDGVPSASSCSDKAKPSGMKGQLRTYSIASCFLLQEHIDMQQQRKLTMACHGSGRSQ